MIHVSTRRVSGINVMRYVYIPTSGNLSFFVFRSFSFLATKDLKKNILLSNIMALSVIDDGYSRNASCTLNLISTFLLWKL